MSAACIHQLVEIVSRPYTSATMRTREKRWSLGTRLGTLSLRISLGEFRRMNRSYGAESPETLCEKTARKKTSLPLWGVWLTVRCKLTMYGPYRR